MDEPGDSLRRHARTVWPYNLPDLDPPPRPVPWTVQWQVFTRKDTPGAGILFIVVSLVFLHALRSYAHGLHPAWQVVPLIHLTIGLGLVAVPIVLWRRRVAVLKYGELAPARILGVLHHAGPGSEAETRWEEFELAFARTRSAWNWTTSAAPAAVPVLACFGCAVTAIGLFGAVWTAAVVALIWLGEKAGERTPGEKLLLTLGVFGFMAVFLAVYLLIRFVLTWIGRTAAGGVTPAAMGLQPSAWCRFTFPLPDGRKMEVTANVDLRARLLMGRGEPDDTAVYLPGSPGRVLLVGGFWPPVAVSEGGWAGLSQREDS